MYNELNDYLQAHVNYPGWKKGVYPIRDDAVAGIKDGGLYVASISGKIVGSIILSHKPEHAYLMANWQKELKYSDVFVIYTFAIHPDYWCQGVGKGLLKMIIRIKK